MAQRNTIVYFPLESYPARYTSLTSTEGGVYERAFENSPYVEKCHVLRPWKENNSITRGNVLDYATRTKWCAAQLDLFFELLPKLNKKKTAIYFEDFWTPGMEMVPYAMAMENQEMPIYSFCHAQTPDMHDFTYPWRAWMRPFEQAWIGCHSRIFCSSSVMVSDWRQASMPGRDKLLPVGHAFDLEVWNRYRDLHIKREPNYVVFGSRIASEKNPHFFARLASKMPNVKFAFLSGRQALHGESSEFINAMEGWLAGLPNLELKLGLTKESYMAELQRATCLFNCAYQDYVSYVLLDAVAMGADVLFPYYRSFPNALHNSSRHLYQMGREPFNEATSQNAVLALQNILKTGPQPPTGILHKYHFSVERMIRVMMEVDGFEPMNEYESVFNRPLSNVEEKALDSLSRAMNLRS